MISDFWNHVAIVVFFSVCAVIWVRSLTLSQAAPSCDSS
jgi:hypothetical protein